MGSHKHVEEEDEAFLAVVPLHDDAAAAWTREEGVSRRAARYLRLALEIVMAVLIVVLAVDVAHERTEDRGEHRRTPVPKFPRKTYTFLPDPQYVREDMLFDEHRTLEALHNWIPLSADARGYIHLPSHGSYAWLGQPFTVAVNRTSDGPAYMMSVFHQLHCLSYVVEHYQRGYGGAALTGEVARHSAHCFDYLRQSVLCAADANLEGDNPDAGPGWGSNHQCVDYDAVLAWANQHGAMPWRNGLLPGESVL
ncbi:hypothetical protein F4804DRAFT_299994 [Jackrogersella minutella]|nr:hypothetical protein F4804DRAFT_299994 [Jackrogersella minutella]